MYATKELSRKMSEPRERDWEALKRLGRYLVDKGRYQVKFDYQEEVRYLEECQTQTSRVVLEPGGQPQGDVSD